MNFKYVISKSIFIITVLTVLSFSSCKNSKNEVAQTPDEMVVNPVFFKLSLAQWSLNKQIKAGEMNPFDFPQ